MSLVTVTAALFAMMQTAPETPPTEDAASKKNEVVCKFQTGTNTRFKKKTCMTIAEWDRMAEQNKRNYGETRDRPVIDITRDN